MIQELKDDEGNLLHKQTGIESIYASIIANGESMTMYKGDISPDIIMHLSVAFMTDMYESLVEWVQKYNEVDKANMRIPSFDEFVDVVSTNTSWLMNRNLIPESRTFEEDTKRQSNNSGMSFKDSDGATREIVGIDITELMKQMKESDENDKTN